MKKNKINKKTFLLIAALICLTFFIVRSFSKYVIQKTDTHIQSATEFYFESDIAEINTGKEYIIKDWNGNEENIEFNVKNYLNKLLVTNEDITYKISTEVQEPDNINVVVKNKQNEEVTDNQIITGSQLNDKKYVLNIAANNKNELIDGTTYNIKLKITAISPYTKELIANIKLIYGSIQKYEANLINETDKEYVKLNLKINEPQEITIKYDNTKLLLDESNYMVNDINVTETESISTFSLIQEKFEKGKNYEIDFIKKQEGEITLGTDIKVE